MDSFLMLVEKIANLEEDDKLQDNLKAYRNIFEGMKENQELINDLRRECRLMHETTDDIISKKEDFLKQINYYVANDDTLSIEKKKILTEFLVTVSLIYDKVMENLYQDMINIRCQLCRPDAKVPTYAHDGDAGFDFYLPEDFTIKAHEYGKIAPTGLKMIIPVGYELQIRPRSGNSVKTTLRIANAPGTIDCGYANEIGIICDNIGDEDLEFKKGDRIAQGILNQIPKGNFILIKSVEEETTNNRNGGFGSSGQ